MADITKAEDLKKLKKDELIELYLKTSAEKAKAKPVKDAAQSEAAKKLAESSAVLEKQVKEQEKALKAANAKLLEQSEAAQASNKALDAARAKLDLAEKERAAALAELAAQKKEIAKFDAERKSSVEELAKLRTENAKLKEDIIQDLVTIEADIKTKEEEHNRAAARLKEMNAEYDKILAEKNRINDEYTMLKLDIKEQMAKLKEFGEKQAEYEAKAKDYDALKESFEKLSAEHDELKTVIKHEVDLLEKEVENKEVLFAETNKMLKTIEENKEKAIGYFKDFSKKLEDKNQGLEKQLQDVIAEKQEMLVQNKDLRNSLGHRLPKKVYVAMKRYSVQYPALAKLLITTAAVNGLKAVVK